MLLLAAANHHQLRVTPTGRVFAIILYLNALVMLCIGIRWSFDFFMILPLAAAFAVVSIALLYLAFLSLGRPGPVVLFSRDWPHAVPLILVILTVLIQPLWIDYLLVLVKLVYAVLLMRLARYAPDALQLVRLHWLGNTQQTLWGSVTLLVLSAALDIAIDIDFALYGGSNAAQMVGTANLVTVCLLGWASVMAGRAVGPDQQSIGNSPKNGAHGVNATIALEPKLSAKSDANIGMNVEAIVDAHPSATTSEDDRTNANNDANENTRLLEQLNHLLVDQCMFADTDLNLQKLARKAGVPARTVSSAINKHTGKNISQWVNEVRVNAACELLLDSDRSVTQIMFEVGFLTKSNFNREFRRLKGCSPSQWRAQQQ